MRQFFAKTAVAMLLGVMLSSQTAQAITTSTATLTVTGVIASSIQVVVTQAPGTPSALNTSAASTAFGTFSFNAPPAGFTAVNDGAGAWHLLSSSGSHPAVEANFFNGVSLTYTIAAYISGTTLPVGVTWKLNSTSLAYSAASPAVLNSAALYAVPLNLPWEIDFSALAVTNSLASQITFVATAN